MQKKMFFIILRHIRSITYRCKAPLMVHGHFHAVHISSDRYKGLIQCSMERRSRAETHERLPHWQWAFLSAGDRWRSSTLAFSCSRRWCALTCAQRIFHTKPCCTKSSSPAEALKEVILHSHCAWGWAQVSSQWEKFSADEHIQLARLALSLFQQGTATSAGPATLQFSLISIATLL